MKKKSQFFQNYDLYPTTDGSGPGTGPHTGQYKSIDEFEKSRKKKRQELIDQIRGMKSTWNGDPGYNKKTKKKKVKKSEVDFEAIDNFHKLAQNNPYGNMDEYKSVGNFRKKKLKERKKKIKQIKDQKKF